MINSVRKILNNYYNFKILKLKKSKFIGLSSNHFEFFDQFQNKYIAKVNTRLDVLIGKDFYKLISQKMNIVYELYKNNIAVEKCIKNRNNNFVTKINKNSILRVFSFQNGNKINYSNIKIKQIANSLSKIHNFKVNKLEKKYNLFFSKKLPYDFNYTSENYTEFKKKMLKIKNKNQDIKFFIKNFDLIEEIIRFIKLNKKELNFKNYGLVHQDYHFGNLILNNSNIYILDFDYLEYGSIEKCRALAILRYSFNKNRDIKKLKKDIKYWLNAINVKSDYRVINKYLKLMVLVEIEKLLRIYMRYIDTREHRKYLIQAKKIHIPNLKIFLNYLY